MANEKRLIDVIPLMQNGWHLVQTGESNRFLASKSLADVPTVDTVEVHDKKLLKAINLLIKQYEHSKNSDYVHCPVAHAFYHTWKQLDAKMDGDLR